MVKKRLDNVCYYHPEPRSLPMEAAGEFTTEVPFGTAGVTSSAAMEASGELTTEVPFGTAGVTSSAAMEAAGELTTGGSNAVQDTYLVPENLLG